MLLPFTFLNIFDQFRYVGGTIVADFLFTQGTTQRREKFWLRAILGSLACLGISLLYFPICELQNVSQALFYVIGAVWWYFLALLGGVLLMFCYRIGPANVFARGALGGVLQNIPTVIVRYFLVGILVPEFPEAYPALYAISTIAIYAAVYALIYFLLIQRFRKAVPFEVQETGVQIATEVLLFTALSVISEMTSGIFYQLEPENGDVMADMDVLLVRLFCVGLHLMICVVVFVLQYSSYRAAYLKREKELSDRIIEERKKQYSLSQQAAAVIRRQSHDLKHQVDALFSVSEEERKSALAETREVLAKYDSFIVTDNESLNTINVIKLSSWVTSFYGGVTQIFVFAYFVKVFGC